MSALKLPIRAAAPAIWRDAPRLLFAHPLLWAAGLMLYGAITFLDFQWADKPGLISGVGPVWQGFLADAATLLLPAVGLIPAALATHRTVILGVVEQPSAILSDVPRIGRYAALECLLLAAMMGLIGLGSVAIRLSDAAPDNHLLAFAAIVSLVTVLALMCVVILRAATCFPAVAVSNDWTHVADGWRALAGQTLRVVALVFMTPVGVLLIVSLGVIIIPKLLADTDAAPVSETPLNIGLTMLMVPLAYLWVLTMSHVYKAVFVDARAAAEDSTG